MQPTHFQITEAQQERNIDFTAVLSFYTLDIYTLIGSMVETGSVVKYFFIYK